MPLPARDTNLVDEENIELNDASVKKIFRSRVLRIMQDKGWSQADLSRRADISRDKISTYLRDPPRSAPTNLNLIKIAQALGVSTGELIPTVGSAGKALQPLDVLGTSAEGFRVRINIPLPYEAFAELTTLVQRVTSGAFGTAPLSPEQ